MLDISSWDVSNVTNMCFYVRRMPYEFNQDLTSWDVSNVIYMDKMFERVYVFYTAMYQIGMFQAV